MTLAVVLDSAAARRVSALGDLCRRRPRSTVWVLALVALWVWAGSPWALVYGVVTCLALAAMGAGEKFRALLWLTPFGDFGRGWHGLSAVDRRAISGALGLPLVDGEASSALVVRMDSLGFVQVGWRANLRALTADHIDKAALALYPQLGAVCHTLTGGGGVWTLDFSPYVPADPLAVAVPWEASKTLCALDAVPLGVRADGAPFRQPVLGAHTLLVGSTGSGKGSVLWSLVLGLMPHVRSGSVELYGIDLKGGVELSLGASAFVRLAYDDKAAIELLEDFAATMRSRLVTMRENGSRLHKPTPEAPLLVLVIDEAGALSMTLEKKDLDRVMRLLKEVLSQGRAAGVSVFAALQDPRKEALTVRDLFPRQLALKLRSADETRMAIGAGLWEDGARCEAISPAAQGTGYSLAIEGADVRPVRFRAFWVTEEQVQAETVI